MTSQEQAAERSTPLSSDDGERERPISVIANEVYAYLREQLAKRSECFPRLDDLAECVCIKNPKGVVVYCNTSLRKEFSPQASPIGRTSHAYHDPRIAARVDTIERLVADSCSYVECEHLGPGPDGTIYRMLAHKRSLRALGSPGFALLGVIRVIERSPAPEPTIWADLSAAAERFREMTSRDQEICRQTALGVSSRELGERLGMTTRGIELRKQKAFAHLGVSKAVELARLLTRLHDQGYLDLGL